MSLEETLDHLVLDKHVQVEQLPDLDLYMDQVIQLFELTFKDLKRDEKEKIMTKTMINNYAKGALLFPSKNKRYSKEHVMIISLIYEMKGALSLKDIKHTLQKSEVTENEDKEAIRKLYKSYLALGEKNTERTKESMKVQLKEMEELMESKDNDPYVQHVLLILSFVHQSNLYRKAAEKLIDELPE
ncbi:DUF1836 domain-containing protein [Alkalicoccus daliensis]|uniref:DUF1836 domain-containing protein n=1 Tax=Alkalicoccus daliensis TaxID=745820 RepID=A0A1H0I1P5_9BACI|nr:DUF1836 domain-containing protein [Alkalicoccus daliensis]SDO25011.1 protein of unknown function [Alkalicoccus daliensis]